MCLMPYVATRDEPQRFETPLLRVEDVEPRGKAVRQWFSLPVVSFVGAHTGCSCGFPSFGAEEPVEFYEGIFDGRDEREADLGSLRALLELVKSLVARGRYRVPLSSTGIVERVPDDIEAVNEAVAVG